MSSHPRELPGVVRRMGLAGWGLPRLARGWTHCLTGNVLVLHDETSSVRGRWHQKVTVRDAMKLYLNMIKMVNSMLPMFCHSLK